MKTTQPESGRRPQPKYYLIALMFFLIALSLAAACDNNQQPSNGQKSNTPAPTPSPTGTPEKIFGEGDSPIIIKGGSTDIELKNEGVVYATPPPTACPSPNNPHPVPVNVTYHSTANDIVYLEVLDEQTGVAFRYWVPDKSKITIHARRRGAGNTDFPTIITGDVTSHIIDISFDDCEYKTTGGRPHFNSSNRIDKDIDIESTDAAHPYKSSVPVPKGSSDKVTIKVATTRNSH